MSARLILPFVPFDGTHGAIADGSHTIFNNSRLMDAKGVREMMLAGMMGNFDRLTDDNGWGGMADLMREMMGPYRSGGGQVFWQFHWILELVTWGLVIALMIAAFRWLWKKGDESGKKR